jgi:hypothetical protein
MNIPFLKPRQKADQRNEIVLIDSEDGSVRLAFGLQWTPIVTSGGLDSACAMARKKGSTHILYKSRALQVGHGFLDQKANPKSTSKIYPAAQVAARQHGGDSLFAIKTGESEYWLAVVRNGKPTSIDKFFAAESDAAVLDEAEKILDEAVEDDTRFTVYTNIEVNRFKSPQRSSVEDLLLAASNPEDILGPLPRLKGLQVPKPIAYAIGAVCLLLLINEGFAWKAKEDRARQQALKLSVPDEPASVAWQRAIVAWELNQAAPERGSLLAVRESIDVVPALWNGWMLAGVACAASPLKQPSEPAKSQTRQWSCSAEYNKSRVGATNVKMASSAPAGWTLTFMPLTRLRATWSVEQPAKSIKIAELKPVESHLIQTAATLQDLSPAFASELTMVFKKVDIKPPLKSDGSPYSTAEAPATIQSAPILIAGPIRTIDAVSDTPLDIDWTSFKVTVDSIGKGKMQASSLKQSAITAEISGELYAKTK